MSCKVHLFSQGRFNPWGGGGQDVETRPEAARQHRETEEAEVAQLQHRGVVHQTLHPQPAPQVDTAPAEGSLSRGGGGQGQRGCRHRGE